MRDFKETKEKEEVAPTVDPQEEFVKTLYNVNQSKSVRDLKMSKIIDPECCDYER
jgi:hypothetical protein